MAAAAAVIVLLALLISSAVCQKQDASASLLRVVEAIEKLCAFYKAEYQHMNLDGIFGLKVLEGQVQGILKEHQQGQHGHLSLQVIQRLSAILQDTTQIGNLAMESVRADDEAYFERLAFVITKPWSNFKSHRRVVPAMRWEIPVYRINMNVSLTEHKSDQCMMEMADKGRGDGTAGGRCSFSQWCGQAMTKRGMMDYGITHQLLWTALAEKAGCSKELNDLLQSLGFKDVDAMQVEFCTNNYYEMLAVVHVFMKGKVHPNYQDLFLEQQFVCPNLGFFEFLKKDYLDQILSWQWPSGCFGDEPEDYPPQQQQQNLPHKMDLSKLGAVLGPKNVSLSKNFDLRVQQQVNSLKSNNQKVKSLMEKDSRRAEALARGSQHIQNMKVMNVNPVLRNPGQVAQNPLPQNSARRGGDYSFIRNGGSPKRVPDAGGSLKKFNKARDAREIAEVAQRQVMPMKEVMPVRGNWAGGWNDHGLDRQPIPMPDFQADRLGGRRMLVYETEPVGQRKLLMEKTMPGGCLAHKTGVAAGALAMYLRFLINPGPLNFYSQHEFFPSAAQDLLNVSEANKRLMAMLGDEKNDLSNGFVAKLHEGNGGGENKEEEEENEDAEYDEQDEMYPDRGGGGGEGLQQEKRVVHFGANNNVANKDDAGDDYDNANEDEEYANEDEDEEDEEEGPDYIKRVKGDDNAAANADDEENQHNDDTEYTYYDDDDNTEKGIIRKHKPQPPPQPGARVRPHNRHKTHSAVINEEEFGQADMPPTKTFVFLLSASSVVLIIFMCRFIKKRRIHLRYHSRGFSKL